MFCADSGIGIIPLSDIPGSSTPALIKDVFGYLSREITKSETGLHLHTLAHNWHDKVDAARQNSCRWFDGVINGVGGCPMTGYEMVGNRDTRRLIEYFDKNDITSTLIERHLQQQQLLLQRHI